VRRARRAFSSDDRAEWTPRNNCQHCRSASRIFSITATRGWKDVEAAKMKKLRVPARATPPTRDKRLAVRGQRETFVGLYAGGAHGGLRDDAMEKPSNALGAIARRDAGRQILRRINIRPA
jgi:hypothetical protein